MLGDVVSKYHVTVFVIVSFPVIVCVVNVLIPSQTVGVTIRVFAIHPMILFIIPPLNKSPAIVIVESLFAVNCIPNVVLVYSILLFVIFHVRPTVPDNAKFTVNV